MKISVKLLFVVLLVGMISCHAREEGLYEEYNLENLLQRCKNESKNLIVVLGSEECAFCKLFYRMLENSSVLEPIINSKYLITRTDINHSVPLVRILNITSTPTLFIVDSNLNVRYINSEMMQESQLEQVLLEIQKGNKVIVPQHNELYAAGDELYQLYSDVLQAYTLLYQPRENSINTAKAIDLLKNSIQTEPYFMNLYLLMEAYRIRGERVKADSLSGLLAENMRNYDWLLYGELLENRVGRDTVVYRTNSPVLFIEEKEKDLGHVPLKKDTEILIKYTNKGDEPLLVTKVDASCGCIKSEWERKPLLKEEKGVIRIMYRPYEQGYFFKRIRIFSSAMKEPVVYTLKGIVK